jgi:hypothetical protein
MLLHGVMAKEYGGVGIDPFIVRNKKKIENYKR